VLGQVVEIQNVARRGAGQFRRRGEDLWVGLATADLITERYDIEGQLRMPKRPAEQ